MLIKNQLVAGSDSLSSTRSIVFVILIVVSGIRALVPYDTSTSNPFFQNIYIAFLAGGTTPDHGLRKCAMITDGTSLFHHYFHKNLYGEVAQNGVCYICY